MSRHFGGKPKVDASKTRVALGLSVIFLVVFLALAYRMFTSAANSGQAVVPVNDRLPEMKMVDVVVPLRKIDEGDQINTAMLKTESRPQIGIDSRMATSIEQLTGMYTRTVLIPGQPVHLDSITRVKPASAIATRIPPGFRAVTIRVDEISSVESWARPGSRVDVNWVSQINGSQGVTTIVQNAEILSANRQVSDSPDDSNAPAITTVTLLVSAKDAKSIKLAQSTGKLELVLRGDQDTGKVEEGGSITLSDLVQGSRSSAKIKPKVGGTLVMGGKKFIVGEDGGLTPFGADE